MIQDTTSATPRLDWLRANLVLALQEIQDGVNSSQGIAAFIDPQGLNDWDIWSFWVEWDTDSLELHQWAPAADGESSNRLFMSGVGCKLIRAAHSKQHG